MGQTAVIGNVYLFKELSDAELQKIMAIAQEKNLTAGEEIFMTGEAAKSFYVIAVGSVKIFSNSSQGDAMNIATLGSGSHFGELPLFDQGNRSATAQTLEPTRLLEITYGDLDKVLNDNPIIATKVYKSCSRFLATRLRNTLGDLAQAREAKLKHF